MPARIYSENIKRAFEDYHRVSGLPPSLVNLRSVFLHMARFHFCDASNYGLYAEALKDLVFDFENPGSSEKLDVQLSYAFSSTNQAQRPAVYVSIKGVNFKKLAIGDRQEISDDEATTTNARSAEAIMRWVVIHSSPDIAAMLAETAADFLMAAREQVTNRLRLTHFDVEKIESERTEQARPAEYYVVALTCTLGYPHTTSLTIESHKLSRIAVDLSPL